MADVEAVERALEDLDAGPRTSAISGTTSPLGVCPIVTMPSPIASSPHRVISGARSWSGRSPCGDEHDRPRALGDEQQVQLHEPVPLPLVDGPPGRAW
jgi:hypothetical protein